MALGGRLSPIPLAALSTCLSLVLVLCSFQTPLAGEPARPRLIQGQCIGKWKTTHGEGNLPELPSATHGPDSPQWNNSVAICALMKSENSTDVREWLMYYKCAYCIPYKATASPFPFTSSIGIHHCRWTKRCTC